MARKFPSGFVDIHGRPIDLDDIRHAAREAAAGHRPAEPAAPLSDADVERVFDALVVGGWARGQAALAHLLGGLGWRTDAGAAFGVAECGAALRRLVDARRAGMRDGGGWFAEREAAETRLPQLLQRPESRDWWRAWLHAASGSAASAPLPSHFLPRSPDESVALLRLVLIGGVDADAYNALVREPLRAVSLTGNVAQALLDLCRWQLLERIDRTLLWRLLAALESTALLQQVPAMLHWADEHLADAPADGAFPVRLRLAEMRLQRGDADATRAALAGDAAASMALPLFDALLPARFGRFAETVAAYPPAAKALGAKVGKRRGFAPQAVLQWYVLALMAQPEPAAWTAARKFCVAESGSRQPRPFDDWGRWAHALAVRLGDERVEPDAFAAPGVEWDRTLRAHPDRLADRVVLAAWLGHAARDWDAPRLQALSDALHAAALAWKADLLAQACVQLGWPQPKRPAAAPPPWNVAYFGERQDAWREALAAITALGDGRAATTDKPLATLQWRLTLDAEGRPHDLLALEPAASARGKSKPLTPLQLKKRTRLDPRDAAVARCLRQGRYYANDVGFDIAQAVFALQNHPAVAFADAPDTAVELVEALPVLEVRREAAAEGGEHYVFKLQDALLAAQPPRIDHHEPPDDGPLEPEIDRRDAVRVFRESPSRARLIRVTPAQRRVAELVAQRWTVPADAGGRELEAALRVLAGHFVLHSDATAGEPVDADARLVARLEPRGADLRLTLAVRPFGDFGPLLGPGHGRARLMALHRGVSFAADRDLAAERAHLAAVLDALPFLGDSPDEAPADGVWLLDDPEHALAAVDELGRLARGGEALRAIEWPKGQPVRVHAPETKAFTTTIASRRDWLAVDGELKLDESRVLSLQQLLGLLREAGGSRYVALGEGQYLRLADQLRQRLAELDSLAEADAQGIKLGATAGAWLADAASDLGLQGDAAWRRRAADLERAAALDPAVPAGLQAALRPYQQEGYVWMRRLAAAGFGAILADDMGLGKTVQTLALLLARAADGPALVVAPTSVCDNWAAEAARFAPALAARVYGRGDDDRAAQLKAAAAGDVVVVSYALLLRDAEAFAARAWATLVLDEAQALKNAATQRVQAVAGLDAGFRLALSGTPVENRLADLWSIMNLLNPGLLGNASRFAQRFGNPIERERDDAARARLRRLVSPFLLRRTKAQVLVDLPPRTEIVQRIEPSPEERALLEAMRREAVERIAQLDPADAGRRRFNVLAELTRLRRAACDPRLAAPELGLVGAKVREFERLAAELVEARHQTLVFSQFTDFLALLAERLDAAGLRYRVLDGSTPAASRAQRVAEFQAGEADFFLISLKAGGFGLNLTAADYVVIADPWWNPAAEDQAMGRAHRIGQQRPVTVYRLVTAGSVEERIVALHHDKRELAEGLLSGQEGGAPLAADDLVALLRDG